MEDNKMQEEFFDETFEVSTEEYKLNDNELEDVSGGGMSDDNFYCYYCKEKHALLRQYPFRIRPAAAGRKNDCYVMATKYKCDKNGVFFTVPLKKGGTAYFNELMQRME
ncbi:MAG: hypothetical protein K5985_00510 [Lachnospiraceae bacterium]|nr:hypothetical protein [Lachnospiraceae bacterium]